MKNLIVTLLFSSLLLCTPLLSVPGHAHGPGSHAHKTVSGKAVVGVAYKKVVSLANAGKIDRSWVGIRANSVKQKTYSKGPEWVVTFKNRRIRNPKKQTLYMFFRLNGRYIAANHTGN